MGAAQITHVVLVAQVVQAGRNEDCPNSNMLSRPLGELERLEDVFSLHGQSMPWRGLTICDHRSIDGSSCC